MKKWEEKWRKKKENVKSVKLNTSVFQEGTRHSRITQRGHVTHYPMIGKTRMRVFWKTWGAKRFSRKLLFKFVKGKFSGWSLTEKVAAKATKLHLFQSFLLSRPVNLDYDYNYNQNFRMVFDYLNLLINELVIHQKFVGYY